MPIQIQRLTESSIIPTKATEGSAGYDLYAAHECFMPHQTTRVISTGLAIEMPPDMEGQIRSRSGLAAKGVHVLNSPGTIDNDYRGEIFVILRNSSDVPLTIKKGQRIAQIVFNKLYPVDLTEVYKLNTVTKRDINGLGSTGE